jgi:thiol-disulfide isomerase/thioredoxin
VLASTAAATASPLDGVAHGRAALEEGRRAYATSRPFQETLELTLQMPGGGTTEHRQVYGVTADGAAFLTSSAEGSATLTVVARDERVMAVWSHVGDRYAEAAYDGDLAAALERLEAARANIAVPPAVAAAQGATLEGFLEALRFGVLAPLTIGDALTTRTDDGELIEVELTAANGRAAIGLDPRTSRLRTIRFTFGEAPGQVSGSGRFRFAAGPPAGAPPWPDVSGRQAVTSLAVLEAPEVPLGQPAPTVELRNLSGGIVHLGDLASQVVVLDFWATWCVPCWEGLEQTEELASWAASSGLPVRVFAVDTLERVTGFAQQQELVLDFLESRGLDLPVALDVGGRAFAAFDSPGLPSLVVIDPDGRLASLHLGTIPDLVEIVRTEVLSLLKR